jgi:bacterioferritin (cytochrome b1)
MSIKSKLFDSWGRWIGSEERRRNRVLRILEHRYADEKQHAERFSQHAARMQYPQFRDALFRIASEELKHADWLAEKIRHLGGRLPMIEEVSSREKNSWQYLLQDLEEERRCADELEEELLSIQSDYPSVVELLQRIDVQERQHRNELREMLMKSDPQALWPE